MSITLPIDAHMTREFLQKAGSLAIYKKDTTISGSYEKHVASTAMLVIASVVSIFAALSYIPRAVAYGIEKLVVCEIDGLGSLLRASIRNTGKCVGIAIIGAFASLPCLFAPEEIMKLVLKEAQVISDGELSVAGSEEQVTLEAIRQIVREEVRGSLSEIGDATWTSKLKPAVVGLSDSVSEAGGVGSSVAASSWVLDVQ